MHFSRIPTAVFVAVVLCVLVSQKLAVGQGLNDRKNIFLIGLTFTRYSVFVALSPLHIKARCAIS